MSVESEEQAVVGRIWDGADVAQEWLEKVRQEVLALQRAGRSPPLLVDIRVGASPLDERLQALQEEACRFTGISYQGRSFPLSSDHRAIQQLVAVFNADASITGIAMYAPHFPHRWELAAAIAPDKDVDGLHPLNLGRLVTNQHTRRVARGADLVRLLNRAGVPLTGAHVVCIGNASGLAGVLTLLCLHENATITAWRDPSLSPVEVLKQGDVLVVDTDEVQTLSGAVLKPGVVVIDARPRAYRCMPAREPWLEDVALLIPVPGGMGPTTVAMRLAALVSKDSLGDNDQPLY